MSVIDYIEDMFNHPERYAKFYMALATALLNWVATAFPSATWLPLIISLAGALGVFYVPNKKS